LNLISGSSGFIGARLANTMLREGKTCRCLVRQQSQGGDWLVADLADKVLLSKACHGVESVFHCAGHAHAFSSLTDTDSEQHWKVNFEGTRNLAEAAGQAGVKRFVFLSSVKAMADPGVERVGEDFPGQPKTMYGQSKRAAEEVVLEVGRRFNMHVVNLRLTMVYGSGGRGNLERMGRLVRKGWFPPLPETGNHRSLVHIDDVVAAMLLVSDDDRANGRTYIIAGPEAPSGRQLYDTMREVLALPRCRWSVPETILQGAARCGDGLEKLLKRRVPLNSEVVDRLLGSAWYSSRRIAQELGWQPKVSLREGLREMFGC
jgi:UDP-glucose 4-epimerase